MSQMSFDFPDDNDDSSALTTAPRKAAARSRTRAKRTRGDAVVSVRLPIVLSAEAFISPASLSLADIKQGRGRCTLPPLVAEFTRAHTQEFNRLVAQSGNQHAAVAGKLTAVERNIAGILRAIEDGLYQPAMKVRPSELEAEKASLMARQGPRRCFTRCPCIRTLPQSIGARSRSWQAC